MSYLVLDSIDAMVTPKVATMIGSFIRGKFIQVTYAVDAVDSFLETNLLRNPSLVQLPTSACHRIRTKASLAIYGK